MKNLTLTFLFLFIALGAKSQSIGVGISTGYGFYDLSDIKSFQTTMLTSINLPSVKAVEKFPNNLYYSFSLDYSINQKNKIGIEFSYLTTGGRNHVADYSGEYKLDMLLDGYQIGPNYEYLIFTKNKLDIDLQLASGIIASHLKANEELTIYDENIFNDQTKMKSMGLFIEPSLKASYNVFDKLNLNCKAGYEYNFKGNLNLNGQQTKISTNWSGIRLSVGIDYSLDI